MALSPSPEPRGARRVLHGVELVDAFAWLRDSAWPKLESSEVRAFLEAENTRFEAWMAPHRPLVERLIAEMRGRIREDDESVPWRDGSFDYKWRFEAGAQYRRWYRRPAGGGDWTPILDEPALAEGHDSFRLGSLAVSPNGRLLAFSSDEDGSERFTVRIRDLDSGEALPDRIPETIGAAVWAADSARLLYTPVNENWRPFAVRLHRLGEDTARDRTLYEEQDAGFFVHVGRTQSRAFIGIAAGDHETSEVRLLPAGDPEAPPLLVAPREPGHEYEVDHGGGRFVVRSNRGAPDFRLHIVETGDPVEANWGAPVAAEAGVYLRGATAFAGFIALEERAGGLDRIRILSDTDDSHVVELPETLCRVALGANAEERTAHLRLSYDSMVTPATVFDYDLARHTLLTRKVQEIPGGHDPAAYRTERLMAPARDGAMIPVSIVRRADMALPGPLHLYGYGAYGIGMPASFSTNRLSLLDRGIVFAIAHVRGGDELGRGWYEAGKGRRRLNSFHDFIDAAEFLVDRGIARPGGISISGGSAGGTLIGAVANMRPELWRAAVAHVPFVDVLNTMLDPSLPLTPIEWPEWGNPLEDAEAFRLIRSYSPCDNVARQDYPAMLVTCGLNDPRVTYWEAAKWVAKLRANKTDDRPLLLKTDMGAGHAGKSGRYESLGEVAEEQAFILVAFGLA